MESFYWSSMENWRYHRKENKIQFKPSSNLKKNHGINLLWIFTWKMQKLGLKSISLDFKSEGAPWLTLKLCQERFNRDNDGGGLVAKSCPTLVTPWTIAWQTLLSMGFSRQEYWRGLSFPSPGDLPDPGIEPRSSALQVDSLLSEPPGKLVKDI